MKLWMTANVMLIVDILRANSFESRALGSLQSAMIRCFLKQKLEHPALNGTETKAQQACAEEREKRERTKETKESKQRQKYW